MKKLSLLLFVAVITAMMLSSCGWQRYKEVQIGDQIWMAENLNVDKFRNGDPIPETKTDEEWKRANENKQPAWCYYENDQANGKIYGKLYNWYAVSDWRGLAPEGWRIPSYEDWNNLINLLGGKDVAGDKLKASGTNFWEIPNSATNETGFTALPGGKRYDAANFASSGKYVYWWSSTENFSNTAWFLSLSYMSDYADNRFGVYKISGLSVRCIKD